MLSRFAGNDEYIYDKENNILHSCKHEVEECKISLLTPENSFLIPSYDKHPEISLEVENGIKPVLCPHCFKK